MSIINSVCGRIFIVVCHRVLYLAHSSSIFSLMTFSASWLLVKCVTTLTMILYILIAETSTKFKKNLKKYFDILENWFYENYTFLYPRKCEFKGFGKTNENEVFTYHEIRLKKSATKKLLGITIDEHLNFNEHLTNVCKRASRKLNSLSKVFLFLAINRKR